MEELTAEIGTPNVVENGRTGRKGDAEGDKSRIRGRPPGILAGYPERVVRGRRKRWCGCWRCEVGADSSHFGSRLLTRVWADVEVQVKEQSSGKGKRDSNMKSSSEEKEESVVVDGGGRCCHGDSQHRGSGSDHEEARSNRR